MLLKLLGCESFKRETRTVILDEASVALPPPRLAAIVNGLLTDFC